jgi:hypothetical protein
MRKASFDPSSVLWTVMYVAQGDLMPYAPDYTGLPHGEATQAVARLRAQYPNTRFRLAVDEPERITRDQARTALSRVFRQGTRPELAKVARSVRRADAALLAPLAFQAQQEQERLLDWQRANEQRRMKGLAPLPKPRTGGSPAQVETRRGRVVIRMGGAR